MPDALWTEAVNLALEVGVYAANWVGLGMTTGRGKDAPTWMPNRSLKKVLGLPLVRDFRTRLGQVQA